MNLTPESVERLAAWRTEIAGELEEATKGIAALEAEHATAVAAASAAESAYRELQQLLDSTYKRVAGPLATRVAWLRSSADEAKAGASRAHGALELARGQVAELQRALNQIDHLLSSEDAEKEAA